MKFRYIFAAVLLALVVMVYSKVAHLPALDEEVKAAWSQTANEYKRRADLIPNLVAVVQQYATHEEKVLLEVTEARNKVAQVPSSNDLLSDDIKLKEFQRSQAELGSALSRLLMITENYPDLKANQNFLALQSQLEGTENRIAVARRDYIEAVKTYNTYLRTFPTNLFSRLFYPNLKPIANFEVDVVSYEVPKVKF